MKFDAAVIGAGIAGNALAKSLADRGWNTVLIERKAFPRHKVCGEFLSPEGASMLEALGVSAPVQALLPSVIDKTRLIFSDGGVLEIPLPGNALGVSRYALDSALLSAAQHAGVHAASETTVLAVTSHENGYAITARRGNEMCQYEARAVIAAWGANGQSALAGRMANDVKRPVRSNAKNGFVGVKSHFRGIKAESSVDLYFFDGGYLGISPIQEGIVNASALMKLSKFPNKPKSVLDWIEAACAQNESLKRRLAHAEPVTGTQAAVAPVDLGRKAQPWGAFPHIGDAALMIPPLCGDGMSMALRSAQLCAPLADRYLQGELSLADWEREYTRTILHQFRGPRQWGRLLQWLIGLPLVPLVLPQAARLAPRLAFGLVQATRLKQF